MSYLGAVAKRLGLKLAAVRLIMLMFLALKLIDVGDWIKRGGIRAWDFARKDAERRWPIK